MKRLLAAAAVLTLGLAGAASGGHARAAGTVRSSRLVGGGHFRITATFGTPARVGNALRVSFSVRNVSKVTRKIQLAYPAFWVVIRSPDGTTYDTREAYLSSGSLGGPVVLPTKLKPGQ